MASAKKSVTEKIKEILAGKQPPPFILFLSKDRIRKERFLEKYRQTFQGAVSSFSAADFDKTSMRKIQDALQSYSLFSSHETIVLNDIDSFTAAELRRVQEELLTDVSANTLVMFGTSLPATSLFLKFCQKHGVVIQLEELKGLELKRWVAKEFKSQGVDSTSEKVVEKIIELGGFDIDRICRKIEIAALFSDNKAVTEQDLTTLFNHIPEESEFILFDLAASGQRIKAELLLKRILQSGKSPFGLVAMWARTVGQLITISMMQAHKAHEANIRESLGIAPWLLQKLYPLVKKLPLSKLILIQKRLLKVDGLLKNRSLEADELLISCFDTVYP